MGPAKKDLQRKRPRVGPSAKSKTPKKKRRFEVITTPVGRQYLTFGLQSSFWVGSGTINELEPGGAKGALVGDFTDLAFGAGPVWVGLTQVVTEAVAFEVRLGAGVHVFENDRLVSTRLDAQGSVHVGHMLEVELMGRYEAPSGLSLGLGANLGNVGLPDASSTLMRISGRLGWRIWDERWTGFTLVEVGYQFPLINGFIPDIDGVDRDPPISSNWHALTAAISWGF